MMDSSQAVRPAVTDTFPVDPVVQASSLRPRCAGSCRLSPDNRQRPRSRPARGFTLIELLTVISIIALLAAIGATVAGLAVRKGREASIRAERDKLVTAIENYKAELGQYPPDNSRVNPVTRLRENAHPAIHALYYELVGTVASDQGRVYTTADNDERLTTAEIAAAFSGAGGFVNSVVSPEKPRSFLRDLKPRQRQEIRLAGANDIELLAVSAQDWPVKRPEQVQGAPLAFGGKISDTKLLRINPWHYVSTRPTNNPATFDLFALWPSGRVVNGTNEYRIFGNWKE